MNERKTGPKRKREEEGILKKARKVIPVSVDTEEEKTVTTEKVAKTSADKAVKLPRVKKPRKTIRGPDGIKIRQVIVPPEPIVAEKKFSHKKKKQKTEESAVVPEVPPKPESQESNKKSKKKKNKKKKKPADIKTPDTDARHGYKALEFLKRWKFDRSEWKFEKLRQVWLLTNILNEKEVNEENFEILLEYMPSVQGRARSQTLKEMQNTMKSIEVKLKSTTEDNVKYERARRIVQMLSDEVDND